MSRPAEDAHTELLSQLPPGWIWPRAGDGSLIGAILAAPATLFAEIEAVAEAMMEQVDPRTATDTLGDFERVLGPDLCGRDVSALSVARRQQLAHQRWVARGGQSIAYYVAMAAARGVVITIEEVRLTRAGVARAGDRLTNHPSQFVWVVRLALGLWRRARAGRAVAGSRTYEIELSDIECDIRRAAPAHTDVFFTYLPADDAGES
ncbi:YmfQ family protein [Ancylobacter defluvii]|uniref:Phage tail protein n=1 Tax=Ancylobacter defluvii TaxID=1282440 RepID=A0A9W6NCJ3_9HYPH|nr:putative phage tail protein [Ancylobacter defluvii]MBS7586396.1 DUF2313 domain-containing protein [Ancylobacter defluvii]GLK85677.1 phage tail protein [Ancylobacter defluvii]